MPHDVIMPALGMAQDTGLIVSWLKAPGDRVAPGEPLFEVETDKATMEVEATVAGYLSAVTAAAGEDVPVGHVIARIVDTEAEVDAAPPKGKTAAAPAAAAPPPPAPAPAPPPSPAPAPQPVAAPAPKPRPAAPPAPQGRILASPKARRLAAEQGLDLARLAEAGHPQPYHVADLDRLAALAPSSRSILTARADATALDALLARAAPGTDRARLFAAFATGAWAWVFDGDAPAVTLQRADGTREPSGPGPALVLADLTGTRLTGYVPQGGLSLSLARDGGAIVLTLGFAESDLPFAAAAAWLDELAARIEDPVRQLV